MKKILILGSTGSIGINTLNVIRKFPGKFKISALTVNKRIDLLKPQIEEFKSEFVVVQNKDFAEELKRKISGKCKILSGKDGLLFAAAKIDYDILVGAMVGFAGLAPTIEALKEEKELPWQIKKPWLLPVNL